MWLERAVAVASKCTRLGMRLCALELCSVLLFVTKPLRYLARHPGAEQTSKATKMSDLELVWWRQNPKKTEEDIERIVAPFLTKAQVKRGFEPWQEKLHLNLFYQRVVTDKDLKPTELGITIKPLRLAAILKSAPMLPQSDTLGFQMAEHILKIARCVLLA